MTEIEDAINRTLKLISNLENYGFHPKRILMDKDLKSEFMTWSAPYISRGNIEYASLHDNRYRLFALPLIFADNIENGTEVSI